MCDGITANIVYIDMWHNVDELLKVNVTHYVRQHYEYNEVIWYENEKIHGCLQPHIKLLDVNKMAASTNTGIPPVTPD